MAATPSKYEIASEARRTRFFAKRLQSELQDAVERGDAETKRRVLWRIPAHLRTTLMVTRGLTEFRKPEITSACGVDLLRLKASLDAAHTQSPMPSAAVSTVEALDSQFQFEQRIRRPELATAASLARALKQREPDHEIFLSSYRSRLGLLGPELDGYIAAVLLGIRKINGEIQLPGDMTVVRRRREVALADFSEDQIAGKVIEFARARRIADEKRRTSTSGAKQLSALDEMKLEASFNLRWRIEINWTDVGELLDSRTARELEQILAGCSVEEMGKTNYNHFHHQIPRIRKAALDVQRAQNIKNY